MRLYLTMPFAPCPCVAIGRCRELVHVLQSHVRPARLHQRRVLRQELQRERDSCRDAQLCRGPVRARDDERQGQELQFLELQHAQGLVQLQLGHRYGARVQEREQLWRQKHRTPVLERHAM